MSTVAQQILTAFDSLPVAERDTLLAELLARHPAGAGELHDAALVGMAEELFLGYDAEEAAYGPAPR